MKAALNRVDAITAISLPNANGPCNTKQTLIHFKTDSNNGYVAENSHCIEAMMTQFERTFENKRYI